MSRGLRLALLLALAGAVLLLAGGGTRWATVLVQGRAPLPDLAVPVQGSDLVPGLRGLGVVALAGVPALLAVRRWGRVVVGALLAASGALALVLVGRVLRDLPFAALSADLPLPVGADDLLVQVTARTPWPWAVLLGGLLLVAAGATAVVRGRDAPALGARFDAPQAAPPPQAAPGSATEKTTWEALDRGEDPTR